MNTFPNPGLARMDRSPWQVVAAVTLGIWLGGSLLLDVVVMPALYSAGMMTSPGFAAAGSLLFGTVNRVELLMGGLVLAAFLALLAAGRRSTWCLVVGLALCGLTAIEAYWLAPTMAASSLSLTWGELGPIAPALSPLMTGWHEGYFAIEVLKWLGCAALLWNCERSSSNSLG